MRGGHPNWFLILSLLAAVAGLSVAIGRPKEAVHLTINSWHSPWQDLLFRAWTFLGDGKVVLALIGAASLIRIRPALVMGAAYALSGITVQVLKRAVFSSAARPAKYFEIHGTAHDLYLVPGLEIHHWHSFPSGHTATAFGVFFGLSLFLKSARLQVLLFILAAGVAWSRVYLSQHFLPDVTAGIFAGLVTGWLGYLWLMRYDRGWMDRSLFQLLQR